MTTTTSPTTSGSHPVTTTILGWPRQGPRRELKKAIEAYWAGTLDAAALRSTAADLRRDARALLREHTIAQIPTGDFSYYDHVLDTTVMLGAIPQRYADAGLSDLDTYFAMARGTQELAPLEMTKWFDTNYHYLVPELGPDTVFAADARRQIELLTEALDDGFDARPVLLGPLSYLLLSKPSAEAPVDFDPLTLLPRLLPIYDQLLTALASAGATWVQIDEPCLVQDQPGAVLLAAAESLNHLAAVAGRPKLVVASYFAELGDAFPILAAAPVEALAVDLSAAAPGNLAWLRANGLPGKTLLAGVVDGRNVWTTDLSVAVDIAKSLSPLVDSLVISGSSSFLHVPLSAAAETAIDPQITPWLAFAEEKLAELRTVAGVLNGDASVDAALATNQAAVTSRATSALTHDESVRARLAGLGQGADRRTSSFAVRQPLQQAALGLPDLPTTTIGSFPQTADVRRARADLRAGRITAEQYEDQMRTEIANVVALQEDLGLDVLVHGEPERNDMVQYFAEQLDGYLHTQHGWVQSYGTRCVRPPILFGDVSRPQPMTVQWWKVAQSLTAKPVKGMLTGPVTMLAWSFVRDDQPIGDTALQVALALRDEVDDLERAGCRIIQVDEPALRETLPLRDAARADYLQWATRAFRVATSSVQDATQIHTHMCYADFGDIFAAIDDLDADVISLEAARSGMALAGELASAGYAKAVGPGIYDIHSPRVPSTQELSQLLRIALEELPVGQIWVNPDCGLKTRGPVETTASLRNLVAATHEVRRTVSV